MYVNEDGWSTTDASNFLFSPNSMHFEKETIWFYWGQGMEGAPEVVQLAYRTWCTLNPDFSVIFLDDQKVTSIIGMSIHELTALSSVSLGHAGKSDLLRLYLLYHFGGVWVDATTFCLKPLSSWLKISKDHPLQHFTQPMTCRDRRLVSWFLAATPKTIFVKDWLQEAIRYLFKQRDRKLTIGSIGENVTSDTGIGRSITGYRYLRECEKENKTPYFWLFYLFNEVANRDEFQQLIDRNESYPQRYVQPHCCYDDFTSAYISKQTYRVDFCRYQKRVQFITRLLELHEDIDVNTQTESTKKIGLLCTGFHRSATSATANYLLSAGLDMGSNLMGGSISNIKGHFEDWDAVQLHDAQLIKSDTSWLFFDEVPLTCKSGFLDVYIQKRIKKDSHWGVKDPRACLFLNEWKESFGDVGSFLFVARHWSSCIESLLHRHSRDLAYGLSSINRDTAGAQFWVQPELAAKMWLSYNKRIVDFAKKNPDITIVATQRALFQGAPILKELNAKFGFELDEGVESPFDASLFRDKANQRIFDQLSYSLKAQLNAVWNELLELATFRSEDETPHIVNDEFKQEELAKVEALTSSQTMVNLPAKNTTSQGSNWLEECLLVSDPSAMVRFLDASSASRLSAIHVSDWLPKVQEKFALNGHVTFAVAKLLQRLKEYPLAIDSFQVSVSLGVYFPTIDMMMAQCWQALGKQQRAEFFFKKSIKGNPNNPIFYTNYAKLLLVLDREVEAEQMFELGYQKGSAQPACSVPYCDFLDKLGKTQKAIDIASACLKEANSSAIQSLLTRLMLKNNVEQGKSHYSEIIKQELANKDTLGWLVQSCKVIDSAQAEEDFMIRCLSHWRKLSS